jgi:AcrR family transcriptional regulator
MSQQKAQVQPLEISPLERSSWIKKPPITNLGKKIVSATVEEFASKGVLGARITEITRLAGTTDPAFYRYFPSIKQAALFIMSEYYWAPLNLRLNHYEQITQDTLQLFEAVVRALIQSTEDDPSRPWLAESKVFRIVVVQMRNPSLLPESMLDSEYLTFISKLEALIKKGQEQKIFSHSLRPALVAQLLVNVLHGLLMQNYLNFAHLLVKEQEIKQVAHRLVGLD